MKALSQSGEIDKTFGSDGIFCPYKDLLDGRIMGHNSFIVQPDNKFLVTGALYTPDNLGDVLILRCNPDGGLDSSFGQGGYASLDIERLHNNGMALALQMNNKIVIAATIGNKIGVIRYNSDGTIDNRFAHVGYKVFDIQDDYKNFDDVHAVVIQKDQKIVVAGSSGDMYDENFFIIRLNSSGTFDTTFGNSGKVLFDINGEVDVLRDMLIQPDGKIITAGYTSALNGHQDDFLVARHLCDGNIDTSFNKKGYNITDVPGDYFLCWCYSIGIQNDGKIIAVGAGRFGALVVDNILIRYNSNGTLDRSFGDNGIVITELGNFDGWSTNLVFQPDNKILVSGYYRVLNDQNVIIYRYNYDGSLDLSFGFGGYTDIDLGRHEDAAISLAFQSNKLLVAAIGDESFSVIRFLLDFNVNKHEYTIKSNKALISPNPIKKDGVIKYDLQKSGYTNIYLFDLKGNLLEKILDNVYRFEGQNIENINLNPEILPGIYFIMIKNNNHSIVIKVIKD